jgi:hypothetical protein
MTKQEWLSYIEQTWGAAQKEAWSEQPRREWVGLTDEEIERACAPLGAAMLSFTEVARAIEAKLRERNA